MNLEKERELFLRHSHFEFLMQYVDWDGKSWVFKESNSLQDTQNYYKDYLHFVDCWSYWIASASREGYKLVPLEASKACLSNLGDVIFDNFGTTTAEVDSCAEKAYKAMLGAVE